MSEIINNNVIASGVKFVDFAGLDHFWSIAKAYINAEDAKLKGAIDAVAGVVGDDKAGLVKDVKTLQAEVAALGGAEGGIQGMIDKSLESYSTTEQMNSAIATATTDMATNAGVDAKLASYSTTEQMNSAIATATTDMATKTEVAETYETIANVAAVKSELEGKIATDVAAAIAEVVANAPEDLDTLKEIADYIASDKNGAAELSNRVADNEAILAGYKTVSESGEKVITTVKSDIATAKSEAIADAKDYTDELANGAVKANTDAIAIINGTVETEGSIAKAKADAEADATSKANTAEQNAKDYADGLVKDAEGNSLFDAAGSASTAESNVNAYTDALANSIVVASLSDIDSIFGVTDHNHEA